MWEIILWTAVFIVSIAVLIKASDFFSDAAEEIGVLLGISPFIVGVTIVAFATSLPELVTSVIAVLKGSSEIVVGNVVGSNVANIFLVLGVTAIMAKKITITREIINNDLPIFIGSAFLFGIFIYDGKFTVVEALISIGGLIFYLFYSVSTETERQKKAEKEEKSKHKKKIKKNNKSGIKAMSIIMISSVFILLGANYTIESVIRLSEIFDIGKEMVAISAIAVGTSLPELVVSISLLKKGNSEMAVGNVLGSNIFNTFAVMGIPACMGTLIIPQSIISVGLPIMVIATLLYLFITQDKEITKWEGGLLLIFYVVFIGKIFNLF